jgi:hypothetical protein
MKAAGILLCVFVAAAVPSVTAVDAPRARLAIRASASQATGLHEPLDRVLDTYVRGGLVYYRALKSERAVIDRYVASLDLPPAQLSALAADGQKAFWINAYNALVLRTVIDAYPIKGKSPEYPVESIRQIPGAFERRQHRVAGQMLTLDEIETRILAGFGDARVALALGRGAIGSGRLRSEAFIASKLTAQLDDAVKECVERKACFQIDRVASVIRVSPMIGWRAELFERYFRGASGSWASRSPIERAIAAMAMPHLLSSERDVFETDAFKMQYGEFDWRLNDLTSR